MNCSTPVSYTHLDVYKRQVYDMVSVIIDRIFSNTFLCQANQYNIPHIFRIFDVT